MLTLKLKIDDHNLRRLRGPDGRFVPLTREMHQAAHEALTNLGKRLESALKAAFAIHEQSSTKPPGSQTIDTFRVVPKGEQHNEIEMGGGAVCVEKGSAPHIIRARNSMYLHFWSHGREFFLREVHHPGYVGDPFVERAENEVKPDVELNKISTHTSIALSGYGITPEGQTYPYGGGGF